VTAVDLTYVHGVYATRRPGDAYPLPRPDRLYDYDRCDEMTGAALATLDKVRAQFIARDGGTPSGRANCALIDTIALDVIADEEPDDEEDPDDT